MKDTNKPFCPKCNRTATEEHWSACGTKCPVWHSPHFDADTAHRYAQEAKQIDQAKTNLSDCLLKAGGDPESVYRSLDNRLDRLLHTMARNGIRFVHERKDIPPVPQAEKVKAEIPASRPITNWHGPGRGL